MSCQASRLLRRLLRACSAGQHTSWHSTTTTPAAGSIPALMHHSAIPYQYHSPSYYSDSSSTQQRQQQQWQSQPHSQQSHYGHAYQPITHATTILCVRKGEEVVVIGDGQATQNDFVVKANVTKVRRIGDTVIGGFAGMAADGLSLLERLEGKLEEHPAQLLRACVELAKLWRQDKMLRELDASLLVADAKSTFWLMGNGDVLESVDGIMAIGSGSDYAESAAKALMELPNLPAMTIAQKAMKIAADCCVYTNHNFTWHCIHANGEIESGTNLAPVDRKTV
eukprot:jgi/Chrzof1/13335/Cz07g29090.t1